MDIDLTKIKNITEIKQTNCIVFSFNFKQINTNKTQQNSQKQL